MKKRTTKVQLHRETLLHLDAVQYVGGGLSLTCPDRCDFSGRNTCTTCRVTCTTNFC